MLSAGHEFYVAGGDRLEPSARLGFGKMDRARSVLGRPPVPGWHSRHLAKSSWRTGGFSGFSGLAGSGSSVMACRYTAEDSRPEPSWCNSAHLLSKQEKVK